MIRLTIAHYYTPSGRCIQKPYTKGENRDYAMDVINRLKSGELTNADSIHFADSLKYQTLREHRTVYGGGGIMPDEYCPLDTTIYTKFHRELAAKSIILQQNLRYVDNHRKQLKKAWPSFAEFKEKYEVPQDLVDTILKNGEKQNIKPKDQAELEKTLPYLRLQLKALIARDIWDMSEYFSVFNEENAMVKRALEVIAKQAFTTIDVDKFQKTLENCANDCVLVDVRTPEEFNAEHLKGAINIDVKDSLNFMKKATDMLPKKKTIMVYCRTGHRSSMAAGKLAAEGYKVLNLKGGITAWKEAEKETVK
jgi:carboxyl-terminal processing protease